jgi:very-short-patch-repair endonuclease
MKKAKPILSLDYADLKKKADKRDEKNWRKEGYDSPIEKKFHKECFKEGLSLEMQKEIAHYRVDFYAEIGKHKLVIELDGSKYHSTNQQITKDVKRQRSLQMMGYTVIRFSGSEIVKECKACVYELKQYINMLNGVYT